MANPHTAKCSLLSWCVLTIASAACAPADDVSVGQARAGLRGADERQARADARTAQCEADPRVVLGLVSFDTCIGADLFFHETFGGNGRTCGSCHPAANNYTLDADFIATLPETDPLFVAEQNPELAELERSDLLRKYGLILVNPDGFEAPTTKFVMRSVSHMLGLATSITAPPREPGDARHAVDGTLLPPLDRLGWSGDGSPGQGQLRDFADGAITQHMTRSLQRVENVDFFLPSDPERDAIAEFSRSIGRMNELDIEAVRLTDKRAERGRDTFLNGGGKECAVRCHTNAGANSLNRDEHGDPVGGISNFSFDIGTALVRVPEVDAQHIPLDGGFGKNPPLDLDGDGKDDSFGNGGMNVSPLIEAADTLPFFHSHAFATLEDAIGFYASDDFAHSFVASTIDFENRGIGEPMPLSKKDIADVGRFLRVLNTALNCQMALSRLRAALEIMKCGNDDDRQIHLGLLKLGLAEIDDAASVLGTVDGLNVSAQFSLAKARALLELAQHGRRASRHRSALVRRAITHVNDANAGLGTGLEMEIGAGTLMF